MNTFAGLSAWDPESGSLNVVIETPKGNRNKFDFDPKKGFFQLGKVLPKGMTFPYDFGFIPGTRGDDGDPLDVLVLMDEPAFPGCQICCRLIGVIEGEQTNGKGKAIRNDRLLALAEECHDHQDMNSVKNLAPHLLEEIEQFFASYHKLDGKEFRVLACRGPKKAEKLVRQGAKRHRAKEAGGRAGGPAQAKGRSA